MAVSLAQTSSKAYHNPWVLYAHVGFVGVCVGCVRLGRQLIL
jgi:hypothetical protein